MTVANLCAGPANSGGAIELALNFLYFFLFFKKKEEEDCSRGKVEKKNRNVLRLYCFV